MEIEDFGLIRLVTPIAIPLLLPALAGISAAMACENTARLALPDPARAAFARAAWAVSWAVMSLLVASSALLVNPDTNIPAIGRNLLVYIAIGLTTLCLGYPHLMWLPALAYTIASMMFGYDRTGHHYYWWAVVINKNVSASQFAVCGIAAFSAIAVYVMGYKRIQ